MSWYNNVQGCMFQITIYKTCTAWGGGNEALPPLPHHYFLSEIQKMDKTSFLILD